MSGPLPNVPKVVRVDFFQTLVGAANIRDRIFLQYSGALSTTDLTTILGTISAAWNTNLSPDLVATHSLVSIEGTDLSSATAPQVVNGTAHAGTASGTAVTAGAALVIKFKIARRYRGGHPRFYLAGAPSSVLASAAQWAAASLTAYVNAFSAFITACVASPPAAVGTLQHVNVSYFQGFANKTYPSGRIRPAPVLRGAPVVDLVTGYSGNPRVASQRRRNFQSP